MSNLIPHFIAGEYGKNKLSGNFEAASIFLDISGFTAMSETLSKNGIEGNEILCSVINRIFATAIDLIYEYGGFVSSFAGDAMTAIFINEKKGRAEICARNSVACALKIKKIFDRLAVQKTKFGVFRLSMKIGMSYGKVFWHIIENHVQNIYFFKGPAVTGSAECERHCAAGEIILDKHLSAQLPAGAVLNEVNKGCYNLDCNFNFSDKRKISKTDIDIPAVVAAKFSPASVIELKISGEFRNIVSCFISFKPEEKINESINKLINLSHEYGGYFSGADFADKGGSALIVFGAPVGNEKLFERALGFAFDAVESMKRFEIFPLAIGLTFSKAFAGFLGSEKRRAYTVLGPAVNLSARMAASATPGEILMNTDVYVNIRPYYEISPAHDMKFKGFEEKIPVYKLLSKKENKIKKNCNDKLIGRRDELDKISKCLEAVKKNKNGGIVYVDGAAGSGKTRFVNELRLMLGSEYNWFYMPCDPILKKSFNPFISFFKNYFNQPAQPDRESFEKKMDELAEKLKSDDIKKDLRSASSYLGALIGLYRKNSPYELSDARARYANTLEAVKIFLNAESSIMPTVIEIEDGHCIDGDSVKAVDFIMRGAAGSAFVILSECRYNDDGSAFLLTARKGFSETRIQMNSFDASAAESFVKSIFAVGDDLQIPLNTIDFIYERSDGNPFYIEQIATYLMESALIDNNFNLSKKHFEIPSAISSIIVARLDRLASQLKEIAQIASVIGQIFPLNILNWIFGRMNSQDAAFIEARLSEGENQLLWNVLSEIKYIFKHSLIRESIYGMQLKERLRKLHRLAGEAMEVLHIKDIKDYYAELAVHFENAGDYLKAVYYLEKAAKQAREKFQNESAAAYYDRVLNILSRELWPADNRGRRASIKKYEKMEEILCEKGKILELTGGWQEAGRVFKKALSLSLKLKDEKRIANALLYSGIIYSSLGNYKKALKYLFKSLKLYEDISDIYGVSKVSGFIGFVYLSIGELERSIECFEKKLKICRRRKDLLGISHAVGNLGIIHFRLGKNDKALSCYKKQLIISGKMRDQRTISAAIGNIGTIYLIRGNYAEAMKCYRRQLKLSGQLGNKVSAGVATGNMGAIYFMTGSFKKSLRCFEDHLKIATEIGDKNGMAISMGNIGDLQRLLKNYETSEKYLNEAIALKRELNLKYYLCNGLFARAELYFEQKRLRESLKNCEEALNIAGAVKNEEQVFKARLLTAKIKFAQSTDPASKEAAFEDVSAILKNEKNMERAAGLNYELYKMAQKICAKTVETSYRAKSLTLYKKLYKNIANYEYKQRIKELERAL